MSSSDSSSSSLSQSSAANDSDSTVSNESSQTLRPVAAGDDAVRRVQFAQELLALGPDEMFDEDEVPEPQADAEKTLLRSLKESADDLRARVAAFTNTSSADSLPGGQLNVARLHVRAQLQCPLCFCVLRRPCTFPQCSHTVCEACLRMAASRAADGAGRPLLAATPLAELDACKQCPCCAKAGAPFSNAPLGAVAAAYLATLPGLSAGACPSDGINCVTCDRLVRVDTPEPPTKKRAARRAARGGAPDGSQDSAQDGAPELKYGTACAVCSRVFCSGKGANIADTAADRTSRPCCAALCRPVLEWGAEDVARMVPEPLGILGNAVELEALQAHYGRERYAAESWALLLDEVARNFSAPFLPFVGAATPIDKSCVVCYRCLGVVLEAACQFARARLAPTRARCLCGVGCILQYTDKAHAADYEHSGKGARGDQSMTIFDI